MFLRAFVEIPVPAAAAAEALRHLPEALIQSFATEAVGHGHAVLAEVGVPLAGHRLGKQVEIRLGDAIETSSRTWLPISWRATEADGFFPALEGELESATLGKELTQIGLSARYKPPFGPLGDALDRAFFHRVAEATIQDFTRRTAAAIEDRWAPTRGAAQ